MPYNQPGIPAAPEIVVTTDEAMIALGGELDANLARPGSALSLCLWGSPGIAKSAIVHQVARARGIDVIEVRAAQIDPVDLRGLPTVIGDESVWLRPRMLPKPEAGPKLIFLDEINRAPVMVRNSLYQLLDQRRIGEHDLSPSVLIVGACNRETDGGGVQKMEAALAGRYVHLNVEPNLGSWSRWAAGAGINPALVAFLNFRQGLFNAFDPKSKTNPTPRTWTFVDKVLQRSYPATIEHAMIAGCVGQGPAAECSAFMRLWRDLPDMDDLLADPAGYPVPPASKPDHQYAVAAALSMKATPRNFRSVLTYLDRLPGEFAVFAVKDATARDDALKSAPGYTEWEIKHQDALK